MHRAGSRARLRAGARARGGADRRGRAAARFCGHGVIAVGRRARLRELAEKADIPVAATLLGLGGFPASHPLSLGMMGMHGEAWVNHAIQEADLLVALGMRFDDRVTGKLKTYAAKAKKIHVEIDPAEMNKNVRVDVALVARLAARAARARRGRAPRRAALWRERIAATQGRLGACATSRAMPPTADSTRRTSSTISGASPRAALVVTDVGQHQMWEAQYYKHDHPRLARHLGRPRHDGLRAAGGDRRQARPTGRRGLGGGRATAASR